MLNTLKNRFEQGCRTSDYPNTTIELPKRYRGQPQIHADASSELAAECAAACPQEAIDAERRLIDLGRCVFCTPYSQEPKSIWKTPPRYQFPCS